MIFTPDDQPSKQASDQTTHLQEPGPEEPPPSYSVQTATIATGSTSTSAATPTFKTKPTNFLALCNGDNTIRGEFVIDPSIRIPDAMLPPLDEGETENDRKNLSLRSKHGSVHAEIWLLAQVSHPETGSAIDKHKPKRTTIRLISNHDSIRTQLHTFDGAAPFFLTARAPHGSIRVALPRSFHGLLSLSTRDGSVSLSDTLVQNATQLGQVGTTRRYFIGDFQVFGEGEWEGDQIEIDAHDSVRLKYVDEGAEVQGKKGLLSRLLGK